ncbi:MAG: M14 family zinc carboxypeptidase [candidate division WOR-3 bacterium]
MRGIFLSALVVAPLFGDAIVRVYGTETEILAALMATESKGLDRVGGKLGQYTDFWIHNDGQMMTVRSLGLPVKIIDPNPKATLEKADVSYMTWAQILTFLQNKATTYSNICVLDTIGWTYQGRPILMLKLSDNPTQDEDEPEVLVMGLHHAREWPAVATPIFIIDTMTKAYGTVSNITDVVNNREIYFIPCVNPDGYYYCHDQGNDWRKNRHYFSAYGVYGTDLNRNYDGAENGVARGAWGAVDSSKASHYPDDEVHTGLLPADSEVLAVQRFVKTRELDAAIGYHTYSELVLWPLGYTQATAPDDTLLRRVGQAIASQIGGYQAIQSSDLYPTSGDSDDWIYGWFYYTGGRITPAYTVEEASQFQPPQTPDLDTIVVENFRGALYLMQEAGNIRNNTVPYPIIGSISAPETSHTDTFTVSWAIKNPRSNPTKYHLQRMIGYTEFTDDCESNYGYLDLHSGDWTRSTTRAHSGSYSYEANNTANNKCRMLSTCWPYYVKSANDSLTFWIWYNTESYYDAVEVAVSENGRDWEFLDKWWGSSSNWVRKAYSLAPWTGKWLYFAIYYMLDPGTRGQGVYVDDIKIAYFVDTMTIDTNITATSYKVSVPSNGIYYHRVKPKNTPRGWADWSHPVKTIVDITGIAEKEEPIKGEVSIRPSEKGFAFIVPEGASFSLRIYDATGRMVRLYDGIGTGKTQTETGFNPGIYIGLLSVGGRSQEAKAVIR